MICGQVVQCLRDPRLAKQILLLTINKLRLLTAWPNFIRDLFTLSMYTPKDDRNMLHNLRPIVVQSLAVFAYFRLIPGTPQSLSNSLPFLETIFDLHRVEDR